MLLSLGENGLTSLFKEVTGFSRTVDGPRHSLADKIGRMGEICGLIPEYCGKRPPEQ